jgi:hypothetical protein
MSNGAIYFFWFIFCAFLYFVINLVQSPILRYGDSYDPRYLWLELCSAIGAGLALALVPTAVTIAIRGTIIAIRDRKGALIMSNHAIYFFWFIFCAILFFFIKLVKSPILRYGDSYGPRYLTNDMVYALVAALFLALAPTAVTIAIRGTINAIRGREKK